MNTGQDEEPLPSTETRKRTRRSSADGEDEPQKKPIFTRARTEEPILVDLRIGERTSTPTIVPTSSTISHNERQSGKEEQIRRSSGAGESDSEEDIASRRQKPAKPELTEPRLPRVKSPVTGKSKSGKNAGESFISSLRERWKRENREDREALRESCIYTTR
ncbi:hypothetical protein DY000_02010283 [Brassica cretica]|uniref:Uncharacterized protein n=1 Tax=Brassica cretica TaxID=69181 RepID=A0ABQ7CD12_BRACR|nr:hypothetical protein DY000_02010283 [Brassica cretica]